jgi:predicted N-acetyltransferase YhbS
VSAAVIRQEAPGDAAAIEAVLDAAFGPGRFAKVSERVRERAVLAPDLSVVALEAGRLIGCCRLYHVAIGAAPTQVAGLFLGPLAVDPAGQAGGVGQALVGAALGLAQSSRPIVLVGQPAFFARFGFTQVPDGALVMPGPTEARRLQWLHAPDGLSGPLTGPPTGPRAAN